MTHSHNCQARARKQRAKKVKGNCLKRCEAVAVSAALPVAPQRYTGDPAHQNRSDARRCGRRFLDLRPSITTSPLSIHPVYIICNNASQTCRRLQLRCPFPERLPGHYLQRGHLPGEHDHCPQYPGLRCTSAIPTRKMDLKLTYLSRPVLRSSTAASASSSSLRELTSANPDRFATRTRLTWCSM